MAITLEQVIIHEIEAPAADDLWRQTPWDRLGGTIGSYVAQYLRNRLWTYGSVTGADPTALVAEVNKGAQNDVVAVVLDPAANVWVAIYRTPRPAAP